MMPGGYTNKDINKLRNRAIWVKGLGTQVIKHTKKNNPRVIVGHDYRSYSEEIKISIKRRDWFRRDAYVEDIGLSLSPTVYFAQFEFKCRCHSDGYR